MNNIWNKKCADLLGMDIDILIEKIIKELKKKNYPFYSYPKKELKEKLKKMDEEIPVLSRDGNTFNARNYAFDNEQLIDYFTYPEKIIAKYNDLDSLETLFSERPDDIAIVLKKYFKEYLLKLSSEENTKLRNGIFQNFIYDHADTLRAKEPSHFPTLLAKSIYENFSNESSTVFDISCGWGNRLMGAYLANVKIYVGCDPNTPLFNKYFEMIDLLRSYKKNHTKFVLNNIPAEDYVHKHQYDLVFSSPPYFDKEIYNNENTQSIKRYPTSEDWVNNFLIKTVLAAVKNLKTNGYLILYMPPNKDLINALFKNRCVQTRYRIKVKSYRIVVYKKV